jgi:outer membrane protein assembly factor BamB
LLFALGEWMNNTRNIALWFCAAVSVWCLPPTCFASEDAAAVLDGTGLKRGLAVILEDRRCELALDLVRRSEFIVYVQLSRQGDAQEARRLVDEAGHYGTRIYVEHGDPARIPLADNLADVLVALEDAVAPPEAEVLRVINPNGKALVGGKWLTKPFPQRLDDWSHPNHGPDNNPVSSDHLAKAPYLTQFVAEPRYAPLPQAVTASAGRIFKAFGNYAPREREKPWLNTLLCINAYNGTVLWRRKLKDGVLVHRNTMIATPDVLYLADDTSCKLIDARTGKLRAEIVPPRGVIDETFWKWMALDHGVLYAMVGGNEPEYSVITRRNNWGGWSWGDFPKGTNDEQIPWGFGRTLMAVDPTSGKLLWHHREEEPIDSRGICMRNGRLIVHRYGAYLACLDAKTGRTLWRRTKERDPKLFEAIGPWVTKGNANGWKTAAYLKCNDEVMVFSGNQVEAIVGVSMTDGKLLWRYQGTEPGKKRPFGEGETLLRGDEVFALYNFHGPSAVLDAVTGKVKRKLSMRSACARPTGAVDGYFVRATGTKLVPWQADGKPINVSPVRPACTEGITVAGGHAYCWPMTCDCYGLFAGLHALAPRGDGDPTRQEAGKAVPGPAANAADVPGPDAENALDWPTLRKDNRRSSITGVGIPEDAALLWRYDPGVRVTPTAPIAVGSTILLSGSDGVVRALNATDGKLRWKAFTGGGVLYPPTVQKGRVFVGSADGWVYAFRAKDGGLIWKFPAAPTARKIMFFGALRSTWPAISGVLVERGVAYVAAGMSAEGGVFVYALDAETGKVKWRNATSGDYKDYHEPGMNVKGHLLAFQGGLYLSGRKNLPGKYDMATGKYYRRVYRAADKDLYGLSRGSELFLVNGKVRVSGPLLYAEPDFPAHQRLSAYGRGGMHRNFTVAAGDARLAWVMDHTLLCFDGKADVMDKNGRFTFLKAREHYKRPAVDAEKAVGLRWQFPLYKHTGKENGHLAFGAALAVAKNAVVVTQEVFEDKNAASSYSLNALALTDGKALWRHELPASPVAWGLAVDRSGRSIVALRDGRVLCFGSR